MESIFWVVAGNLLAIGVMYAVQAVESRAKLLPRRSKKFLYLQDWYTTTWGDFVGLSIFDAAVVPQILAGTLSFQFVIYSLIFGFLFTAACFAHFLSPSHRPDAGAPRKGVLSFNGLFHAIYFFSQASMGAYAICLLMLHVFPMNSLSLAVLGAGFYLVSFGGDWKKFF